MRGRNLLRPGAKSSCSVGTFVEAGNIKSSSSLSSLCLCGEIFYSAHLEQGEKQDEENESMANSSMSDVVPVYDCTGKSRHISGLILRF